MFSSAYPFYDIISCTYKSTEIKDNLIFQDSVGSMAVNEPPSGGSSSIRCIRNGVVRCDPLRSSRRVLGVIAAEPAGSQAGWSHAVFLTRVVFLASTHCR